MASECGSSDQNGKLSQITTRDVDEPLESSIAAQVFGAMRKEPRKMRVLLNELGFERWEIKVGSPTKPLSGYDDTPG